jgi:hypothetical protein
MSVQTFNDISGRIPKYQANKLDVGNFVISVCVNAIILAGFALFNDKFAHWFIIPVLLCGSIIGVDAINWFRGKVDPFDLTGILGVIGVHFFFLAPLLHVEWNVWMKEVTAPADWRDWLGYLSILNFIGLLIYRFTRKLTIRKPKQRTKVWVIDTKSFKPIWLTILFITFSLQMYIFAKLGGIGGYINALMEGSEDLGGIGIFFMFSESFPIILVIGAAFLLQTKSDNNRNWIIIFIGLAAFLVLQMLFGGLRGSRSNTLWALFWAVGIIHCIVRPITRKVVLVGLCFVVIFMYVYGFYKNGGVEGISNFLQGKEQATYVTAGHDDSTKRMLLGDLARSDIQSMLLYRITEHKNEFDYALGSTYAGAVTLLIPRAIWSNKPPTKEKAGTEALFGKGSYIPEVFVSSRVYGLLGEAVINFGIFAIPFAFGLWGYFVGHIRRLYFHWKETGDTRIVLLPMLINLCFVLLVGDSNNIVFFIFKTGLVPFIFVVFASKRAELK